MRLLLPRPAQQAITGSLMDEVPDALYGTRIQATALNLTHIRARYIAAHIDSSFHGRVWKHRKSTSPLLRERYQLPPPTKHLLPCPAEQAITGSLMDVVPDALYGTPYDAKKREEGVRLIH